MPEFLANTDRDRLIAVYEDAKRIGLLGPGPVVDHIDHGFVFVPPLLDAQSILDLGSGAGVPGLLLALCLPNCRITLLDGMAKRCAFLRDAVAALDLQDRVEVAEGRAEDLARSDLREKFDAVSVRSFAPPAVTAECSVGFLKPDGIIVVSEPPSDVERWPSEGLEKLGLQRLPSEPGVAVLQVSSVDTRWPRRVGIPAKRPLF